MSAAIIPANQKVSNIRQLLERSKAQFAKVLPKHLDTERLLRMAMTSFQKTPTLLDCTQTSLLAAVMNSAQMGLEPDTLLGQCYLIPRKNKGVLQATLIIGYKGLLDLARRSGAVLGICARAVFEDDEFEYELGLEEKLYHVPMHEKESSQLTFAYAIATMREGPKMFEVMSRIEIDRIRSRAQARDDGPWATDYSEMAKKTVLRRLCKMLPASTELARAVAIDERAEAGVPQQLEDDVLEEVDEPASSLDAVVAREKQRKATDKIGIDVGAVTDVPFGVGQAGATNEETTHG